ncbi:MAG: PTS sugar transporter subunit IIA [Verrucomicrobia bacterium]|nr:PTS sugar transporter subunit IIA [Verrucomicrobiota bacterium]
MDLKLRDVAELLNVSETTIRRWISDSKIPYYRLNHQFRFSRNEIENWVLSCKQGGDFSPFDKEECEDEPMKLGTQQFGLYRAIHKGGVYTNVPGDTKEEVICNAMKLIARDLSLDADVITELLLDREQLMPTALSNGVGVPHTRDFLLQDSYDVVALVFPQKPIQYGALDNIPVHTLFFLFACDDKRHLHLLAKLAHLSSKQDNLDFMRRQPSKEKVLEAIKNWESNLRPIGSKEAVLV